MNTLELRRQIEFLKDMDNNEIIYSKEQENDNHLRKTNPYAVNRHLYLIGDILTELTNRIETLEKEIKRRE